jgi:CBS domain containing-hemolysin-like protein
VLFLAFLLVLLNGFFVATEFAIVKVRASRVREMAEKGNSNARIATRIISRLDAYLSACQLGITIASLGLGWIGEAAFARLIEPLLRGLGPWAEPAAHAISITIAFAIIMILHIVAGELAPKSLAIRFPVQTALVTARPMQLFYRLFYPFIWALNSLAIGLLKLFGLPIVSESELAHSEEDLRLVLADSARRGGPRADRRRALMEQAFSFSERRVREIMVPRADIAFLDINEPLPQILETARREAYTRYPLVREQLDDVVGIIHVRELFAAADELRDPADLERLTRTPLFVPESAPADELLNQFQQRRLHMAIVVDEYGGTSGIATLEDVVEELTGEILDEFDVETPPIVDAGGGCVRIIGVLPVADLARHLGVEIESDEAVTTGGLILEELGRVARAGDVVRVGDLGLRVLETRNRRVVRVLAGPYEKVAAAEAG